MPRMQRSPKAQSLVRSKAWMSVQRLHLACSGSQVARFVSSLKAAGAMTTVALFLRGFVIQLLRKDCTRLLLL